MSFFSAAGLPASEFVGDIASTRSATTKRARSFSRWSIFASSTNRLSAPPQAS
jgi:hypothetical protein